MSFQFTAGGQAIKHIPMHRCGTQGNSVKHMVRSVFTGDILQFAPVIRHITQGEEVIERIQVGSHGHMAAGRTEGGGRFIRVFKMATVITFPVVEHITRNRIRDNIHHSLRIVWAACRKIFRRSPDFRHWGHIQFPEQGGVYREVGLHAYVTGGHHKGEDVISVLIHTAFPVNFFRPFHNPFLEAVTLAG